ncbi:5-formyltetrahydrofolate cyclo-ligase [Catellatospora tritici]|uniref:5-formyltetrahydrofolate cyclo-ligase n=1 Tax=Catellatospora tritici TaxID=2851566 RepID=UPI001C2DCBE7|nr:5-formyltetrahydrofolate cyclo-ligase [Catellatospora tritici]MBV1849210.1 5-formyltetrahydrofolate cyclo-ligase [Catellatospora tritici]
MDITGTASEPGSAQDFAAKQAVRASLLAARRALTPAEVEAAAAGVRARLGDLLVGRRGLTICAYVPIGREPGGPDLPERLAALPGVARLLLPVLQPDLDLDWAAYTGPTSLVEAARGLREPAGPVLGRAAIATADLVLVPAVAVDRAGVRLGRGGGSYDRGLTRVTLTTPVVALLYDLELLDRLPAQEHDQRVHAALTPTRTTWLRPVPGWSGGDV